MEWLSAGVTVTLLGSITLTAIYLFLYFQEKQKHLLIWSISWLIYSLRFVFNLLEIFFGYHPVISILSYLSTLISGIILLLGVYSFIQKEFPKFWIIGGFLASTWIITAVSLDGSIFWITFPLFTFLALVYIWTGRVLINSDLGAGKTKKLTGWIYILWGIHKADYPLLRPVEWFAPWGFLLGGLFELSAAIGLLVIYFENVRVELKASKTKYQVLFDTSSVGIIYLSQENKIISINPTAAKKHNKQPEEMIGMDFTEMTGPNYEKIQSGILQAQKERNTVSDEILLSGREGELWILNHYTPVYNEENEYLGTQIISDDISNRKFAEKAFYQSQQRLIESQDMAKIGWWEYDIDQDRFLISEGVYRQLDIPLDQDVFESEYWKGLTHEKYLGFAIEQFNEFLETGSADFEIPLISKSGNAKWLWIKGEVDEDIGSGKKIILGMSQDITEKKQAEIMLNARLELYQGSESLELAAILQKALDEICELVNSPIGFFHTLEDEKTLTLQAWSKMTLDKFCQAEGPGLHYPVSEAGVWADSVRLKQPIIHNDYEALPNKKGMPEGHAPIIRELVVPIIRNDKVVAILGVGNKPSDYQDQDVQLVSYYADLAWEIAHKKQSQLQLELNFNELNTLHQIDQIIVSGLDQQNSVQNLLKSILNGAGMDAAILYEYDPVSLSLIPTGSIGVNHKNFEEVPIRIGQGIVGKVAKDRVLIHFCDIEENPSNFKRITEIRKDGLRVYYGLPLISKNELKGVLELYNKDLMDCDQHQFDLLNSIGTQLAIALDNFHLVSGLTKANQNLQIAYETTLEGWAKALELRDQETEGHSERVTDMAVRLARKFGLKEKEIVQVRRGAMLHDIGKMGIPDSILHKPGPLNDDEWKVMKTHPQMAYNSLKDIEFLRPALDIPYYHHEKWDGSGYPLGLQGDQIPIAARIFAPVDVYDALSSDRPYRDPWPKEKIIDYMKSQSGIHFDPHILDLFWEVIDS